MSKNHQEPKEPKENKAHNNDHLAHLEKGFADLKDCLDECLGAKGADAVEKLEASKQCAIETLNSCEADAPIGDDAAVETVEGK